MVEEAARDGVEAIAAVGTAGLRIARNSDGVRRGRPRAHRRRGRGHLRRGGGPARVPRGDGGARLGDGSLVVFDTGGGSSQFTFGHGDRVDERFSVDVGAVRFTERFGLGGAVSDETLREALAAIAADLARLDGRPTPDALVGMGGAVTNLAAVKHGLATYDPDVVQGTVLDRAEIDRQIELYRTRSADHGARSSASSPSAPRSSSPARASCGPCSTKLGKESLTVSDRGLRHGVLVERFGGVAQRRRYTDMTPVRAISRPPHGFLRL